MCFGKVSAEFETVSDSVRVDSWVCVCQCVTSAWQRRNETCTRRVSCVLLDCGEVELGLHFGDPLQ